MTYFKLLAAAVLGLLLYGCIQSNPRTGSHEMDELVKIEGMYNTAHITFTLHKGDTQADNKGGGTLTPGIIGDKAVEAARQAALDAMTGGASAAARGVKEAIKPSPTVDAAPVTPTAVEAPPAIDASPLTTP